MGPLNGFLQAHSCCHTAQRAYINRKLTAHILESVLLTLSGYFSAIVIQTFIRNYKGILSFNVMLYLAYGKFCKVEAISKYMHYYLMCTSKRVDPFLEFWTWAIIILFALALLYFVSMWPFMAHYSISQIPKIFRT